MTAPGPLPGSQTPLWATASWQKKQFDTTMSGNEVGITGKFVGVSGFLASPSATMTASEAKALDEAQEVGGGTTEAVPTITALSPTGGPVAGGTSVTITGTTFTPVSAVRFGVLPATSFTVNSATSITAVTPGAGPGVVDVTVVSPDGTSAIVTADKYTYS
jgi:hypothetical protein